jgi:hypothetical protein
MGDLTPFNGKVQRTLKVLDELYGNIDFLDKVNFSFTENGSTIKVNKDGFHAVARAVVEERILVQPKAVAGPMASVAAGLYSRQFDTLYIDKGRIMTKQGQATIVHECTHALGDLQSVQHFTMLSDESIAFLAETMWLKAAGVPLPNHPDDPEHHQIYVQADMVVAKNKLNEGAHVLLTSADIVALRSAVKKVYLHVKDDQRVTDPGVARPASN